MSSSAATLTPLVPRLPPTSLSTAGLVRSACLGHLLAASDVSPSAFAASVFINDKFISTVFNGGDHVNAAFPFPAGSVVPGQDNVLTVIQDNMGNDEDSNEKSARGIAGFSLSGNNFTTWKVQGKVGGYTK